MLSVDHRPPTSAPERRPVWLDRPHRRAPDRFVPSVSAPFPFVSAVPLRAVPSLWRGDTTCCVDCELGASPSATTSDRLPSNRLGPVRSMSRTNTFKRTRAPPSLQTLAAANSKAQPLRPTLLLRRLRGGGQERRKTATPATANRKGKGQSKSSKANGPHCDLIMALSWSRNTGHTPFFRRNRSIDEAACCCQPVCGHTWGSPLCQMWPKTGNRNCPLQDLSLYDCLDRPHIKTSLQCTATDWWRSFTIFVASCPMCGGLRSLCAPRPPSHSGNLA